MVLNKIKTYGELVMFSHTIFSLPFALIAMFIAADGLPSFKLIVLILIALVSGRTGANAINRWIDKDMDKKNPRTASRHIPMGDVKEYEVILLTIVCYIIFVVSAYFINPICFYLSPVALFLFTLYSYTKRFTWACHIVLGITVAGAPVGAWLAVRGSFDIVPLILGAIVALWVSGFDILYGTQDIEFDKSNGVYSIPAYFGLDKSLIISKVFHSMMLIFLVTLNVFVDFGIMYNIGIVISAILLYIEHNNVDPNSTKIMKHVSYSINQIISIIIFSFATIDIVFII
ncbi:MAG: UbiA-like polyprenyltransferase [Acidaminobacteraceae bacterium]